MSYRSTYTTEARICRQYGRDPESYPFPLKRTHGHYKRRCTACCKYISRDRRSSYCADCNAARRRDDRARAAQARAQAAYFEATLGRWGKTTGEAIAYLLGTID